MASPRRPPRPNAEDASRAATLGANPKFQAFLAQANAQYYCWDELKRRPLPLGLKPDQAWNALKVSRLLQRRALPLLDEHGHPFSYWLPDRAHQSLHTVDRQGGNVLASNIDEPVLLEQIKDRMLIDSLMEEAIATSQ